MKNLCLPILFNNSEPLGVTSMCLAVKPSQYISAVLSCQSVLYCQVLYYRLQTLQCRGMKSYFWTFLRNIPLGNMICLTAISMNPTKKVVFMYVGKTFIADQKVCKMSSFKELYWQTSDSFIYKYKAFFHGTMYKY